MNKYILPLVCPVAALGLTTLVSSAADEPPGDAATYQPMDDNSYVETESDSAGTYDVFYDRLAPEGRWLYEDDYGYVWQPNVAESTSDWRPYADGHWVWTDRGWYWDSNEDFGWATYHYGRWILVAGVGWVWVPGDQWAPAWVSWRQTDDDDYVGWAPLPPEASFTVSVGFHPWCDSYYDIGPAAFAFIRIGDFCRPSYREFFAPPQQNLVLINRTTNVTNITYNNSVIYNYGPQYQRVSQLALQRAGQQVPNYKINYAVQRQPDAAFKTSVKGNQLNVIAPPQKLRATATAEPKVAKQLGKAQVERGWQNVPQTQAQQLRHQFAEKAQVPNTLPAKPVLPAKPQIHAITKGEQQKPGGPGKGPQGANGELQPFIQKPGNNSANSAVEKQKLEQQKPGGPEKGVQGANGQLQPFIQKSGNNSVVEKQKLEQQKLEAEKAKGGQPEKAQVKEKPAGQPAQKTVRAESSTPKKEVKKGPTGPPQGNASRHPDHVVAYQQTQRHTEKPHYQQPVVHAQQPVVHHEVHANPPPHVAQAPHPQPHPQAQPQPHPQAHAQPQAHPQPHGAANNNGKKKKE